MSGKKRFFMNHSKSSAAIASIALHLVLLLMAGTFVAVQVVVKSEKKFEAKQVVRPRMPPKKLQVPVKIKKKHKPRLRKRIVVQPRVRNMPEIKMPEISGIKGGLGAAGGAGLGDGFGIGFSMPELNIFGVRSKGEKVFIALDSSAYMMRDEVGGMRAYQIIKDELARIIGGLPSTTLFNLAVYDFERTFMLFPKMVPATPGNVGKVKEWLDPLNRVSKGMGDKAYGSTTLGKGGARLQMTSAMIRGRIKSGGARNWYRPAARAMVEQADTVFILAGVWGYLTERTGGKAEWTEANRKRWNEYVRKARKKLKEENERRAAKGEPPRVLANDSALILAYFSLDVRQKYGPPVPKQYSYTGEDYAEALHIVRREHAPKLLEKSGLPGTKKDRFSLNVVYFTPPKGSGTHAAFKTLSNKCRGDFRVLKGLDAIENSASGTAEAGTP